MTQPANAVSEPGVFYTVYRDWSGLWRWALHQDSDGSRLAVSKYGAGSAAVASRSAAQNRMERALPPDTLIKVEDR